MKKRKTRAGNLQAFQDASLKLEPLKKISIENSMGVQIRNTKAQLTRVENRLKDYSKKFDGSLFTVIY